MATTVSADAIVVIDKAGAQHMLRKGAELPDYVEPAKVKELKAAGLVETSRARPSKASTGRSSKDDGAKGEDPKNDGAEGEDPESSAGGKTAGGSDQKKE